MNQEPDSLSIVVIGASGHLARTKIFPALFALFCQGYLPKRFHLFGFARSKLSDEEFRQRVAEHLTCRYVPDHSCPERMQEFLARASYVSGDYGSRDSLLDLYTAMRDREGPAGANRFYYLAIPPSIFIGAARAIGDAGLVQCGSKGPWSRVVLEKPFGHDRESSDALSRAIAQVFVEDQTYRIDHYLGKEVIQNLMVLRFANLVLEPLWNRDFIRSVKIVWKEDVPLEGRGGYFDQYGIIRDVVQNHLLQILALVAMEPPARLDASHVAQEKAKVLRSVPPLEREDLVIGQYGESTESPRRFPAYVDDPTVADGSLTPTFAAARLSVENPRWQGVPFLITAGKGLDARMTEIRIQFRDVPGNVFCAADGCPEANQMVIRVQPDEAIYLSLINKVPGLGMTLQPRNLDLRYEVAFGREIPDAYESLLLDVIQGDKSLFIRGDELQAAWDVFTPVLHQLDRDRPKPEPYAFGSRGPAGLDSEFS